MSRISYVSIELVREKNINYKEIPTCNSPSSTVTILNDLHNLENASVEKFVALFLDTKHKVMSTSVISVGTANASLVHPREVFKQALMAGAVSIIVAHNHPSGNPQPSPEDLSITKRLQEAGELLGVNVVDHVIIGYKNYISFKEAGYIE